MQTDPENSSPNTEGTREPAVQYPIADLTTQQYPSTDLTTDQYPSTDPLTNHAFVPGPRAGPTTRLPTSSSSTKLSSSNVQNIVVGVVVSVILVIIGVGVVYVYWRSKVSSYNHMTVASA